MSDVKRLPDADGWWWASQRHSPLEVVMNDDGCPCVFDYATKRWELLKPGRYLPCPAPEWPPEPPPRPQMVWAACDCIGPPQWWARDEDGDWTPLGSDFQWRQEGIQLEPHDHPEQSAEESRQILEAENNS